MLSTCIRTRTMLDGSRWMGRWRHRREMGSSGRVCAGAHGRGRRAFSTSDWTSASRCGSQLPLLTLPFKCGARVGATMPLCFALERKLYVRPNNHACFYLWAEERGSRLEREARAQVREGTRGARALDDISRVYLCHDMHKPSRTVNEKAVRFWCGNGA